MPRKKFIAKKETAAQNLQTKLPVLKNFHPTRKTYIIILVIGLLLLAIYKKSWFVSATVNGEPITNLALLIRLNQDYGQQTLNQLINEKIIIQEGKKHGIIVTQKDINSKIAELEKQVGGAAALNNLLSQQGQTRQTLGEQLQIQIIIEKLYGSEATVSAQEIDAFILQNKDSLQSSDSAKQRIEAENAVKQQKLTTIFNQKFQELKNSAKVSVF